MAKKTPRRLNKKISGLLTGITMAAILILGFLLLRTIEIRQDANRFAEADRIKQAVFDDLIKAIGITPIQIEEKNVCYNSEQGPYDDGRLWCRVSSAAYFAQELASEEIEDVYRSIIKQKKLLVAQSSTAGGTVFYGGRDLPCTLIAYRDWAAISPGYYFPNNESAKQTLILRCAARAKAKHYPYID